MKCKHEQSQVVVYNELAPLKGTPPGFMLTVAWCPDCGAIRRHFPAIVIDWEIPRLAAESNDIVDWKHSG